METQHARQPPILNRANGSRSLQIRKRFLRPPRRRRSPAKSSPHPRAKLPPLGCSSPLRRRRIRNPHARNNNRSIPRPSQQTTRLDSLRSATTRQERNRQLRHSRLSAPWLHASRTNPGSRQLDVSLETPRRQRRKHHRRQSQRRNQKVEARCPRSLSRRNSKAPIQHRPGSLRRNPPPHRSIHPLAGRRKSQRATRSIASIRSRNSNVASPSS